MMLDTNALSALLAGDTQIARVWAGVQRVAIPVVVLGEYRYGLKRSPLLSDSCAGVGDKRFVPRSFH